MRRLLLIAVLAACGGSSKPAPTAPLPGEPKEASAAPAPPAESKPAPDPAPSKPAPPAGPVEVKIPAAQTTVKVVSGGKGKKETVRYTAKAGSKQAIELAMDFTGKQDTEEQIVPTIVLTGEAETRAVDKDGNAEYTVTVTGTDARSVAGSQVPVDKFKAVIGSLAGLTIGGTLGTTGVASDVTLRIESPGENAADTLELLRLTYPALPVLPKEAVGLGAKWQSTTSAKLADRLDVTQVTDYELVAHNGATWTIKGTTKVTGKDQSIEDSKVSAISGSGTSETTISAGALYPTHKASVETQFKAQEKDKQTQFTIKVGGAVTPRAP
ncbi:MAG TPA: DUF6263 family protein [Kofleriaceae bacterium]